MKILVKHADKVTMEAICPICRAGTSITIASRQYVDYFVRGKLAQNVFPDLDPTLREAIISEICPKCQKSIFG